MDWLQVIVLSLLQGFTEFLPISSSAHLILPSQLLGWQDQGLAFDVAAHVGTLLAVISYFRRDIFKLTYAWGLSCVPGKLPQDPSIRTEARLAWYIILATIPAGLAGLFLGDIVENHLRATWVIATTTIVFGLLLGWADRYHNPDNALSKASLRDAILIGFSQALALIPGTSRSGITMTMALALGWSREAAARFSFLLSIPIILAAGAKKTKDLLEMEAQAQWGDILLGAGLSFLSAYVCIHLFLKFLQRIGFMPFVYYRLVLGAFLFVFVFLNH